MPKSKNFVGLKRRDLLWVAVIVLGLYVIIPQLKSFRNSWHLLVHPNLPFLILSIIFVSLTYFAAAGTYCLLALKPLSYIEELAVQMAAMFVNRLLPAGIGGIGANYEYLKKKGHTSNEAATIVAVNNSLGAIGHFSILIIALLLSASNRVFPISGFKNGLKETVVIGLIVMLLIITMAVIASYKKVNKGLKAFFRQLASYRHKPFVLLFSFLTQVALSLANIYCLFYAAEAVGIHLSFPEILIIFTFGSGIRNVVPTPGGIGGFEAGLVAGFVAYKVSSAEALAAVLLYRLVSFWGPLVIGAAAFIYVESRRWFAVKTA
jgi:glycosyltransferase 2 family protein